MKQALINILNAIADRIKPQVYEYKLIKQVQEVNVNKVIVGYTLIFFCKKSGATKIIKVWNDKNI